MLVLLACWVRSEEVHESEVHTAESQDTDMDMDTEDCDEVEVCNGVDDDCDDLIDEGLLVSGWVDSDGDGFGSEATLACPGTEGVVDVGGDCNDEDASINPDGEEVCGDAIDQDCDGQAPSCRPDELSLDDAVAVFRGEAGWRAGYEVRGLGDVSEDGVDDLLISGTTSWQGSTDPTCTAFVFHGPVSGEVALRDADAVFYDASSGLVCHTADTADLNGDGVADLISGAHWDGTNGSGSGAAYVFLGPLASDRSTAQADGRYSGHTVVTHAGFQVRAVGDVDGDTLEDLLISTYMPSGYRGAAYVVLGPATYTGSLEDVNPWVRVDGEDSEDYLGNAALAGGDLTGDGLSEVLVSSVYAHDDAGRAYLFTELPDESTCCPSASTATWIWTGEEASLLGYSADIGRDMDGDGEGDVVISAAGRDPFGLSPNWDQGRLYVVTTLGSGDIGTVAAATVVGPQGLGVDCPLRGTWMAMASRRSWSDRRTTEGEEAQPGCCTGP